jgi:Site-specific recombinase XerC
VSVIKNYKTIQDGWKKSGNWHPLEGLEDLVFTSPTGKPIRHQTDNKHWRQMLDEQGIPYLQQHSMRHLAISLMISNGEPIEIVRAIAGHSNDVITRAVYTHLDVKSKVGAMESLVSRVFREREKAAGKASEKP